tara:strand:- start:367 stop:570 length:204 start_codon:yes stop_codon:yes gene_type:complete
MEEKRYVLVNLFKSDWEGVEEISYDEFKEYVYFESNVKDMFDDVEVKDIGNGLKSYISEEFVIIELE